MSSRRGVSRALHPVPGRRRGICGRGVGGAHRRVHPQLAGKFPEAPGLTDACGASPAAARRPDPGGGKS